MEAYRSIGNTNTKQNLYAPSPTQRPLEYITDTFLGDDASRGIETPNGFIRADRTYGGGIDVVDITVRSQNGKEQSYTAVKTLGHNGEPTVGVTSRYSVLEPMQGYRRLVTIAQDVEKALSPHENR